jgi:hypothetical protein
MSENKIKYVEKGWGEAATFFTTNEKADETVRVDEIREEFKQTSIDGDGFPIYRGYKNGKIVFEMGASIDVTAAFE